MLMVLKLKLAIFIRLDNDNVIEPIIMNQFNFFIAMINKMRALQLRCYFRLPLGYILDTGGIRANSVYYLSSRA